MTLREWMHEERIGTSAMARLLGVTPAAVTFLKKRTRGASAGLIAKIETLTHGRVKAADLIRQKSDETSVPGLDMPAVVTKPIRRRAS